MSNTRIYGPIWIDPERVSGVPCFTGTRVPVQHLFDHIGTGETLDMFVDEFPSVLREQALEVVMLAGIMLTDQVLLELFHQRSTAN